MRTSELLPCLQLAKLDGTANEHEVLGSVEGFPHLVLFPAGADAQPVPYPGDRSIKVRGLQIPAGAAGWLSSA